MAIIQPAWGGPLVNPDGTLSRPLVSFLQAGAASGNAAALSVDVTALTARVAALEANNTGWTGYGINGITVNGDGAGGWTITLDATTDNVPEGLTNLYFTDARARAAAVIDSIADADVDHAPSRNAVFDALALKADAFGVQNVGYVYAGPASAMPALPAFRLLVATDIPDLSATYQILDTQLTSLAGLAYGSNALKVIRVNAGETGFELATVTAGSGDVVGPASAVNNRVVFFDGTTGKLIKDSGLTLAGTNTGDQTITLTGDVTGSGTGSFAATIANDAVTYAKMQNASANTFIARAANSSGDLSEVALSASQLAGRGATGDVAAISLGSGLSMSGTTLNSSGGGNSAWTTIPKTSDESRNTTAVLADDATLVVALSATTRYVIRIRVYFLTANATMDFKFGLAYTGTNTDAWTHWRAQVAGAAAGLDNENQFTTNTLVASQPISGTTTGPGWLEIDVNILTGTAGTFKLQWSQDTSNGSNLTVKAGSYLEWMTS